MNKTLLLLLLIIPIAHISCQNKTQPTLNLSFEKIENGIPVEWENFGSPDYIISIDSFNVKDGKYAALIEYKGSVNFKALSLTLPHNYGGKKITLSGYIKTENVSDGYAGLWMRIDPNIAFDNMNSKGISGTTGWTKYEITLDLKPDQTDQIVFGGLLAGKGKMWLDQLQVTIDGKRIETLPPFVNKSWKAKNDTAFNNGSNITKIKTDSTTVENLNVLGLVWGFVKYYHPAVAKGDYNLDYELFRILPHVLKANNDAERDKILVDWVNKLGPVAEEKNKTTDTQDVKLQPDVAWITSPFISKELSNLLVKIRNAKKDSKSYYIDFAEGVGNPVFKNESVYAKMNFPDAGFRLLALYRYWNIIQYFYPYKYSLQQNWKDVLPAFIPKLINAKNETEYDLALLELIAKVQDTHANIWNNHVALTEYFGKRYVVPDLTFAEGKAVVEGFYDDSLAKETGLLRGDIITSINGKTIDAIIKDRLSTLPASNYPTQLRDLAAQLLRTNDSFITIKYVRNGHTETQMLKTYPFDQNILSKKFATQNTSFKIIDSQIGYLYLGNIQSSSFPFIFDQIRNTKGLIIDLRCYPSEFVVFTLGKYLMPTTTPFVKFSNGHIKEPGLFTFTPSLQVGESNENYYKGKIVILINEITQSQAEYTTMAFRAAPNAIVIGSTTAGADGNVSAFYLPGGISTMISGIGVYYPNGNETQRVGIIPDVVIKPTIEGIKNGKDEVLDKAIEIINH